MLTYNMLQFRLKFSGKTLNILLKIFKVYAVYKSKKRNL